MLAAVAAIFGLAGAGRITSNFGDGIQWLAIGLFLSIWSFFAPKSALKLTWTLFLTTSSAEAQAMQSEDRDDVQTLRSAIEAAMVTPR